MLTVYNPLQKHTQSLKSQSVYKSCDQKKFTRKILHAHKIKHDLQN